MKTVFRDIFAQDIDDSLVFDLDSITAAYWDKLQKASGLPDGQIMYISSHFLQFLFLMAEYPASFELVIHCYDIIKDAIVFVVLRWTHPVNLIFQKRSYSILLTN